jgi:hypothetical protein
MAALTLAKQRTFVAKLLRHVRKSLNRSSDKSRPKLSIGVRDAISNSSQNGESALSAQTQ